MGDLDVLGLFFMLIIGSYILSGIISIFMAFVWWKIFKKAGRPGWESLIPVYNVVVILDIIGLSPIWVLIAIFYTLVLELVHKVIFLGLILSIAALCAIGYVFVRLAKAFGRSTFFGICTLFLPIIFLPILAFSSKSVYNKSFARTGKGSGGVAPNSNGSINQDILLGSNNNNNTQNGNSITQEQGTQNIDLNRYNNSEQVNSNRQESINSAPQEPEVPNFDLSSYGNSEQTNNSAEQNTSKQQQEQGVSNFDLSSYGTAQNDNTVETKPTEEKINPDDLW